MKLRLKEVRNFLALSKQAVYDATGISINALGGYENGKPIPSDRLEALANLYKQSPAYLMGLENYKVEPIEKVVVVESETARLPSYYLPDESGNVIKWKESKRTLPRRTK